MKIKIIFFLFSFILLINSCGLPKETVQRLDSKEKEDVELPLEYALLFPSLKFEQWDKDYNLYYKYLNKEVWSTQVGLEMTDQAGRVIWTCVPSAQTHVQLDTVTMINDNSKLYGEWRCVCNRVITFTDSANHADKKIYRKSNLDTEIWSDYYLNFAPDKFKLYVKKNSHSKFKPLAISSYKIINKRVLLLWNLAKAGGIISFIGLDSENRLIIINFKVQERRIKGAYNTYQASMAQMIFKRMS